MVIKVKYNGEWVKIPYLSSDHGQELVEEAPKDGSQYARQNGVWSVVNIPEVDFTEVYNAIDTKVDKVEGKSLSTNDYVTADKTKVTNINEVIEAATKNITATDISITLDKRNLVTNAVENIELNLPASTTALAGLMLPSDKTKLNGIAAGAEVNVNADWNAAEGDALILNKPTLATVATSGNYSDLNGKPTLSTVATTGNYNDLENIPDLTLVDAINIEDTSSSIQSLLINLIFNNEPPLTQEQYNKILSLFPADKQICKYVFDSAVSAEFGIGQFILFKSDNDINVILNNIVTNGILQGNHSYITIHNDLTYETNIYSAELDSSNSSSTIKITVGEPSKPVEITLHTGGDGTKSLMDDGKYRKLPVYGKNLLLGSGKEVSNSNYNIANYWLTEQIQEGTQVTVTIWGELGEGTTGFALFNSGDAVGAGKPVPIITPTNGKGIATFSWNLINNSGTVANGTFLNIFSYPYGNKPTNPSTIHKIKLEYGDISTEWSPAWEDIPDLEERYAYGVEWDTASSSPDGVRVGNIQLHRELPIQSKMRRYLLDRDGGVKEYLDNELSWGGSYLDYAVMTEMPEHWYKLYFNGTKFRMMLSEIPLPGYKHVDKFYISTYEARIYRTDNLLCSAAGASKLSDPNSVNFRGGDNTSEWDDTYRSLLGLPVTNLTRDQFRQAARKRGSGWEMYTYGAHKTLFWLFAVEYATLNSQKPFNAQKDANGFSQGGLGNGPTQMTDWTNFNNNNPLIQCGYTNEFGNGSGEKAYVVKNASDGTHATLMANRYRGIENPFGHIWKHTDGANIQVTTGDSGLSILWTTSDPSNFSDTSYTGYDKKGNVCRINGHVKKMLLGEDGDIIATEVGGSTSTYWCDNYHTSTSVSRMQLVVVGGRSDDGLNAGLVDVGTTNSSGIANNIGSRLCFFPKYKSTEITTE